MSHINFTEEKIEIPLIHLLTGRGFITGKSGSGKSNTAGIICENLLELQFPLLIIDTEGEYYGLKEKFEILHLGIDEICDIQISKEHSKKIAELSLDSNIPIILDVSGFLDVKESKILIQNTLHYLFEKEKMLKKPFLIIIEEIHEYIPQLPTSDDLGREIIRIAKRGRKRGLGIIGISQRPADVKKDFITQCNWRIWHKLDWENDLQVVRKVLGKEFESIVKNLNKGEAILESDFLDNNRINIKVKKKITFDAGETPSIKGFKKPQLKSLSKELLKELQQISIEETKKKSESEELKQAIKQKDLTIKKLSDELNKAEDLSDFAKKFTEALSNSNNQPSEELRVKITEITKDKEEKIKNLELELRKSQETTKDLTNKIKNYDSLKLELEQWKSSRDISKEALERLADALNIEINDTRVRKLEEKIKNLNEEIQNIRSSDLSHSKTNNFQSTIEIINHTIVRNKIDLAIRPIEYKSSHIWDIITILTSENELTTNDIIPLTSLSSSSVSSIVSQLKKSNILLFRKDGRNNYYSLNLSYFKELIQLDEKKTQLSRLKQQINNKEN